MHNKNSNFDVIEKNNNTAAIWRERFTKARREFGTQEQFAAAMTEMGFPTTQTMVGRWENVGGVYGKGKPPSFPKYTTMQAIAELLGVQVGYLTGETDSQSFTAEKATKYFGLDEEAITNMHVLSHKKSVLSNLFSEKYGIDYTDYSITLNKLLVNPVFARLVAHLNELDSLLNYFNKEYSSILSGKFPSEEEKLADAVMSFFERISPDIFNQESRDHLFDSAFKEAQEPAEIGQAVIEMKEKTRTLKYLIVDDVLDLIRTIWPEVNNLNEGIADFGDTVVIANEQGVVIKSK